GARAERIDVGAQLGDHRRERVARDLDAAEPEALRPALEVGRGEGAGGETRRPEERFCEQRGRALALRARHVQHAEAALWLAGAAAARARACAGTLPETARG